MATKLTFEEWVNTYHPIDDGHIFEDGGEEYQDVLEQNPLRVWTLVSTDYGTEILSGFHYVNRLGYYITEIPFNENDFIWIEIEEEE